MRLLPALALSALLLGGCKKDEPVVRDLGFSYFPVSLGTWVEYQVDSVWRDDDLGVHDSVSYRLLERIEEHFIDPAGRPANRILRYVRNADGDWQVRDVWSSTRDEFAAELTEENLRRLKISFPVRNGRRWDVNVFNTDAELEVAHREVDLPATVSGMEFDSTLVVRSTVEPNPIVRRDLEERYARNVGLVEKHWVETNTQYPPAGPPRVKGFWLRMSAVAYGVD